VVKAKQTRRDAFESLAVEYLGLADRLRSNTPAPSAALKRVIQVEHDHDAPAYFDEQVTLLEAASEGDDTGEQSLVTPVYSGDEITGVAIVVTDTHNAGDRR